jgi:predicted nuclease with RNAse H fold
MLAAQGRQVSRLREAGVLIIETVPAELSAAVVNQYLDLKARHLL